MASSFARSGFAVVALVGCGSAPPDLGSGSEGSSSTDGWSSTETSESNEAGEGTTQGQDTGSETPDPSETESSGDPLECAEGIIEPPEGDRLIESPTAGAGDDFSGSCGGAGADDIAYEWRPPVSDYYVIDTRGADFDTVLYALDGACDGPEVACNNDASDGTYSRLVARFEADQRVVLVVDGVAGEDGTAILGIERVSCPSADLDGVALPAEFSNMGAPSVHGGSCGGNDQPERAFRYTASESGLYSFRARSDDFVPALYLEDGPECGGLELGCNTAINGTAPAEVIRRLTAGQSVTLIVESESGTGDFTIDAELLAETCPDGILVPSGEVMGNIEGQPHVSTTSCGPAVDNLGGAPLPVATYSFAMPGQDTGVFSCFVTLVAGFPASLAVQGGDECAGPELVCELGEAGEDGRFEVFVNLEANPTETDLTLVVMASTSGQFWVDGDFVLSNTCAVP